MHFDRIQKQLQKRKINGWLLVDFRKSNPHLYHLLDLSTIHLTRRALLWIPDVGDPLFVLHKIEEHYADAVSCKKKQTYVTWQEFEALFTAFLKKGMQIAMEYSPNFRNPYVAALDCGIAELVQSHGVAIVTSQDLLTEELSLLDDRGIASHKRAAATLEALFDEAWAWIERKLVEKQRITEWDVQEWVMHRLQEKGFVSDGRPLCAVDLHSALPHYSPTKKEAASIREGSWILLDIWGKSHEPFSIYADLAQVAYVGRKVPAKQKDLFDSLVDVQRKTVAFIEKGMEGERPLRGAEVDLFVREQLQQKGYEDYLLHRSGHNIGYEVHGFGTHLDCLETQDERLLLPRMCFSLEPGLYLPGHYGVRFEANLLITAEKKVEITGKSQSEIRLLGS